MKNTLKFKPNYNGNFRGRTVIFPASPSSSLPQNPTAHTPSPYFHFSSSALTLDLPPSLYARRRQGSRRRRRPPPPTRHLLLPHSFTRSPPPPSPFSCFSLLCHCSSNSGGVAADVQRRGPPKTEPSLLPYSFLKPDGQTLPHASSFSSPLSLSAASPAA